MNRSSIVALVLASALTHLTAAPRVALVRVTDIYAELPSTKALEKSTNEQHRAILGEPLAVDLRRTLAEMAELEDRMSDKNNPPRDEEAIQMVRLYQMKAQEAQTLQREFEFFRASKEKEINRAMVTAMRESLNRISETAVKLGKERGFDMVLDSSGRTNTGEPFILYSKNAPDITEDTMAALQDHETAAAAAREAAEIEAAKQVEPAPQPDRQDQPSPQAAPGASSNR